MTERRDGMTYTRCPAKMPFEDRLLAWLVANPGGSIGGAAAALGVSAKALYVAAVSLEHKGLLAWEEEADRG